MRDFKLICIEFSEHGLFKQNNIKKHLLTVWIDRKNIFLFS